MTYNTERGHHALGGYPPISRLASPTWRPGTSWARTNHVPNASQSETVESLCRVWLWGPAALYRACKGPGATVVVGPRDLCRWPTVQVTAVFRGW